MTAEQLYLVLSAGADDLDPDLEELLLETSWTEEGITEQAKGVVHLLRVSTAPTPHDQQ